jgi:hypothetical protein
MGDEDDTEKYLNKFAKPKGKKLCLKKYKVKLKDGSTVQRTCIKKAGHWGGHQ